MEESEIIPRVEMKSIQRDGEHDEDAGGLRLTQRKNKAKEETSMEETSETELDDESEGEENDCGGVVLWGVVFLIVATIIGVVLLVTMSSSSSAQTKATCALAGPVTFDIDLGGGVSGSTHLVTHGDLKHF